MNAVATRLSITLERNTFTFRFPYDPALVAAVRTLPGRSWHPSDKLWTAPITAAAEVGRLVARMPEGTVEVAPGVNELIVGQTAAQKAALEASRAVDRTDLVLPVPQGLNYLGYQRAGIGYALSHNNVLFGDEMGLGKTIQAIGVVNSDDSIKRVCVVCPASLKYNWKREIEKWSVREPRILVVSGSPPATIRNWDEFYGAFFRRLNGQVAAGVQWLIVNYDIIDRWHPMLLAASLDGLILDEVHNCKNPKAKRTAMVLGKWDRVAENRIEPIGARRVLALTGTPIPNRPIECWPIVHRLAPDMFRSKRDFMIRYCAAVDNGYGMDASGGSNLGELQEKLRSSCMVRRLKKDVLKELPPKLRAVIELPSDHPAVKSECAAWQQHQDRLLRLKAAVELAKAAETQAEYEDAVLKLKAGVTAAFTEMSKLRHEVALAKVPLVIDHLREALDGTRKVLLFAHHLDVIANIQRAFPEEQVVTITGQTDVLDRQGICDRFQTDPATTLFIGNIKAAGVGLTLTASSHVVFAELDWVPGNVTQAEDRAHRLGQTDSVLVQHLVLEGSLDAVMAKRLVDKQAVIDMALDKEDQEITSEPLVPIQLQDVAATADVSRKRILKDAEAMAVGTTAPMIGPKYLETPQARAIHQCLRILAGMCDGAAERDGTGYNKIDTLIGHSLAGSPGLTAKQAALGRKIITKYHRQLDAELLATAKGDDTHVD